MKKLLILVCMLFLVAGCGKKEPVFAIYEDDTIETAGDLEISSEVGIGDIEVIEKAFSFNFEGTEYYFLPEELKKMSKEEFQDLAIFYILCEKMWPTQESFKKISEMFLPKWVTERGELILDETSNRLEPFEFDTDDIEFTVNYEEGYLVINVDMSFRIEGSMIWNKLPKGTKLYYEEVIK